MTDKFYEKHDTISFILILVAIYAVCCIISYIYHSIFGLYCYGNICQPMVDCVFMGGGALFMGIMLLVIILAMKFASDMA